jgi:hypothetical protein
MWIRGNTDRLIAGDTDSDGLHAWVAEALGDDYSAFLGSLPLTQCLDVDGLGDTLFCHATPHDDETLVTPLTPDERPFDVAAATRAFEGVRREDAARFVENFRTAPSRQGAAEYFESLV